MMATNNSEQKTVVDSTGAAVGYFIRHCLNGEGQGIDQVNGAKGAIAYVVRNHRTDIKRRVAHYMVFFKREPLHSFQHIFSGMRGSGKGQTVNMAALRKAVAYEAYIAVVEPRGQVSVCEAADWLSFAVTNKTIRMPPGERDNEASVPLAMLTSWDAHIAECNRLSLATTKAVDKKNTLLDSWMSSSPSSSS